ncbi:META domain-containing protein [Corynebacterium liangguodongii]|uniref:DUF306 domain-containing protein n=1 Tax=Corynebacterium liangguodongii TaxID=2079535 RepID=A0A2S0WEW1_9CORY|nr:META domain-containing protein [Corynebacterium liangguodongii]AWB84264.1 hypothetical protein C3E79_07045 [Corynebacterium liangguodongii]PWC00273.1 META domain-containing protein [Corynebacterium liangguodongii]
MFGNIQLSSLLPASSTALGACTTLVLGACTSLGAAPTAPAEPSGPELPDNATVATGEVLTEVMNTEWIPQPPYTDGADGKPVTVSFVPQGGVEGFRVEGGPCNGYGTAIHPNVDNGTYTTTPLPVTRMACDSMEYEGQITEALRDGSTFYTVGDDTLYIAGDHGALKLNRA